MNSETGKSPARLLIFGCTSFAAYDSVSWEQQEAPNIPDYDVAIVSVPHITEEFLRSIDDSFARKLRISLFRFLDSDGKLIVLTSQHFSVPIGSQGLHQISNTFWSPIKYRTVNESGKSISPKAEDYQSYLNNMVNWDYYLTLPGDCLSSEFIDAYGPAHQVRYRTPIVPYIINGYDKMLAEKFEIAMTYRRSRQQGYDGTSYYYPDEPDKITGTVVLLPLVGTFTTEEALAEILKEEVGFTPTSVEQDWAKTLDTPGMSLLNSELAEAKLQITEEEAKIKAIDAKIAGLQSYRRLLYGTGTELETIVKYSLEKLGATVSPSKYGQEEYILDYDGNEVLMEVKGVTKSITLTHLRQLNDYLLRYQEDTGAECKGILFGNSWRNLPPSQRGGKDRPEFPDNVIRRAEQVGISLVSAKAHFEEFMKTLERPELAASLLATITSARGLAFPSNQSS